MREDLVRRLGDRLISQTQILATHTSYESWRHTCLHLICLGLQRSSPLGCSHCILLLPCPGIILGTPCILAYLLSSFFNDPKNLLSRLVQDNGTSLQAHAVSFEAQHPCTCIHLHPSSIQEIAILRSVEEVLGSEDYTARSFCV